MPLAFSLPASLRLVRYRLVRWLAFRRPPAADAATIDPAAAGWRTTIGVVVALVRAGRGAEADTLIARGLAAFPDDPGFVVEHALSARWSGRARSAVPRFERARAIAPSEPVCHSGLAASLREIGETEAAAGAVAEGLRRFPRDADLLAEAAHIAEAEARFADAHDLFAPLVRSRAPQPDWLRGHAHALVVLGRFEEAEAALARALARHPESQMLRAVEGILASSREDWPQAVTLWAAYRRSFPADSAGWEHYGRAVQGAALQAADDEITMPGGPLLMAPVRVDVVDDEPVRRLMLGFESLGDSCEFGSVQRRYAAEPLGLLRWNDVRLDNLLVALAHRFAGMGEPANTEMPVIGNGEFTVKDKRWDLWMHTFQFVGQADPAVLFPKMCRRVVYLRDKLLDDLEAAEKIFVYRAPTLTVARLAALHAALCAYGPVKLLAVLPVGAPGDFAGTAGDIVEVGERCWVGFLSRLGVADDNHWDIAYEDWVSICRKVAEASLLPSREKAEAPGASN